MNNITFNDKDNIFDVSYLDKSLSESKKKQYYFEYKLTVEKNFEEKEFKIYFFYKEKYNENDIYQVYLKRSRLGWIFPIEVLSSVEHKEVDNVHFLRYAYVAYKFVINEIIRKKLYKGKDSSEIFENFDFFIPQGTFLFILSVETLSKEKVENFEINNFLPSFYLNGLVYTELKKEFLGHRTNFSNFTENGKIVIIETSTELSDDIFLIKLFKEILPFKNNEILDFFYCYQAIELLIEKIYEHRVSKIKLLEEDIGNLSKIKNILYQLKDETSESSRINLLEHEYTSLSIDNYRELKQLCLTLLSSNQHLRQTKKSKIG